MLLARLTRSALEGLITNCECHNRSASYECSHEHLTTLALGVKFVPTPGMDAQPVYGRATERFVRHVRWQAHYARGPPPIDANTGTRHRPRMPALYTPTGRDPPPCPDPEDEAWISTFEATTARLIQERLCNYNPARRLALRPEDRRLAHLNLRPGQRGALRALIAATRFTVTERDQRGHATRVTPPRLVILNADKNLGLTILDFAWFDAECRRQLGDERFYRRLAPGEGPALVRKAFALLERLVKQAADEAARRNAPAAGGQPRRGLSRGDVYLLSRPPDSAEHRTPSFRIIPKVHKPTLTGRPITPANRYTLTPACELITLVLHPFVTAVDEILRDSTQLVLELEREMDGLLPDQEIYLVTGDVEALYTNIPRIECMALLRELPIPSIVLQLLQLVFDYSIVRYADDYYQQIDGFPMGISPAPDVANLYMWRLVAGLPAPPERRLYRRLIDDLFIVWVGPRNKLDAYLAQLNTLDRHIKITWTVSAHTATFLDIEVYKGERFNDGQQRFDLRVHQKVLNRYLYIPRHSFHRASQHRAWIKAELLRYLRNSSSALELAAVRQRFFVRLRARGHPHRELRKLFALPAASFGYRGANRDTVLSSAQLSQDRDYADAIALVDKIAAPDPSKSPTTVALQIWQHREFRGLTRAPSTPWPEAGRRLLDFTGHPAYLTRSVSYLHDLFTREAPPPAVIFPLNSATAGLRWRDLSLNPTLPNALTRAGERRALVVLRRPVTLGALLNFRDPRHQQAELNQPADDLARAPPTLCARRAPRELVGQPPS